ncbi:MAG: ATPase, partial [Bacillota bacterium]
LERAYDVQYGARPIKRFIQKHVETMLSRMIIEGTIKPKDSIDVDIENDKLVFTT